MEEILLFILIDCEDKATLDRPNCMIQIAGPIVSGPEHDAEDFLVLVATQNQHSLR